MIIVTINVPEPYLEAIEATVEAGDYRSRSALIRIAVSEFLKRELPLADKLLDIQSERGVKKSVKAAKRAGGVIDMRRVRSGWEDKQQKYI